MKFSDFDFDKTVYADGDGVFVVSGKTGKREVPFFHELRQHYDAVVAAAKPGQEYVFETYRHCKNVGTLIKKHMKRAGLEVWDKFFINLRSSCITDKVRLGWSRSLLDAVFGNSEQIRNKHYVQPMPLADYAALGRSAEGAAPSALTPALTFGENGLEIVESLWGEVATTFGIPMSGKELLGGFLASPEFVSAQHDVNTILAITSDYGKKKISERQCCSKLKKYFKRAGRDAADFVDDCFRNIDQKTAVVERRGVEPPTSALRTLRSPN